MNPPFIQALLGVDVLLHIGIYLLLLFATFTRKNVPWPVRRRVAIGAGLCLASLVVCMGLRVVLAKTLPPAGFSTFNPVLNLGQSVTSIAGFLTIVSAAFMDRDAAISEATASDVDDGNPYRSP